MASLTRHGLNRAVSAAAFRDAIGQGWNLDRCLSAMGGHTADVANGWWSLVREPKQHRTQTGKCGTKRREEV